MPANAARVLIATNDTTALLRACRNGDAAAWEALIRRYQRLIYAIPRRAGLNDDQAAEIFQRVCVILFEHLERIDRPERLGAWLATTARRESWRQLRRERDMSSLDMRDDDDNPIMQISDSALLPDEVVEQAERQHDVRMAMLDMDERCRRLITMLFYQEEPPPYAEIAAALGVPTGSVGPTRARCLRKLQQILEERDR